MADDDSKFQIWLAGKVGPVGTVLLLLYTVLFFLGAAGLLVGLWLIPEEGATGLWKHIAPWKDRLVAIAALAGAVGAFVHAATSLTSFLGNRKLVRSWAAWYLLRPFIGAALGFLAYFVVRAGLVNGGDADAINRYGIVALAGLFGMFSKQAVDKLKEVFDTLLRSSEDNRRQDRLANDGTQAQKPQA